MPTPVDEIRLYWPLADADLDKTHNQLVQDADRGIAAYCRREGVTPAGLARDWEVREDLSGWGHYDGLVLTCVVPVMVPPSERDLMFEKVRRLNDAGKTDVEIARECGFSYSTARRYRAQLGLPGRGVTGRKKADLDAVQVDALVRYWYGFRLSDAQIGGKIGLSTRTVWRSRQRLGLPTHQPKMSGPRASDPANRPRPRRPSMDVDVDAPEEA